jgi:hypothetical protein
MTSSPLIEGTPSPPFLVGPARMVGRSVAPLRMCSPCCLAGLYQARQLAQGNTADATSRIEKGGLTDISI